jgi:hypothetical protein
MTKFFNASEFARNLTGLVAAVVLGTTLIAAAAGPAAVADATTLRVANNGTTAVVTADAQSNIVASA